MTSGKVVLLTNTVAPDKLGGLERYVRDLAESLVALDRDVTVVAKRIAVDQPSIESPLAGLRILRYDVPSKQNPLFAIRYPVSVGAAVSRALAESGARAVLHAHFPVPALLPALRRQTYVYTLHAPVYQELLMERQDSYFLPKPARRAAVRGLRIAERTVVRRAAAVITLSEFMRNEVSTLDRDAGRRAHLLSGGVDTDLFCPSVVDTSSTAGNPLLFAARRHVPRTGVQELVEAMPRIVAALPDARLVLAGDGLQRPAIEAAIARLGLDGHVRLLGRVSEDDLVAWYRSADLVITPTQQLEGFGLATAESLACGTPALVTPVGANPEVVRALSAKLVSESASSAAMADAVVRLWGADGAEVRALSERARRTVHPDMSWQVIAARHLELYDRVAVRGVANVGIS